jgi:hypothetical protein
LRGVVPTRLYAEAFWFTAAFNESGRGGTAGVLVGKEAPDAAEGVVRAFDAGAGLDTVAAGFGVLMVAADVLVSREVYLKDGE